MTNDFVEALIEACKKEGRPYFIAIGDSSKPGCGLRMRWDLDQMGAGQFETIEENFHEAVACAFVIGEDDTKESDFEDGEAIPVNRIDPHAQPDLDAAIAASDEHLQIAGLNHDALAEAMAEGEAMLEAEAEPNPGH